MAYTIDVNGNITCFQGDTVRLTISGLDTSHNYDLYLEIRNSSHVPMGEQQHITSDNLSDVVFTIPATVTDTLLVPSGQDTETYYYGIKAVLNDETGTSEDTLFLGTDSDFETENTITVYPKKVEGTLNDE